MRHGVQRVTPEERQRLLACLSPEAMGKVLAVMNPQLALSIMQVILSPRIAFVQPRRMNDFWPAYPSWANLRSAGTSELLHACDDLQDCRKLLCSSSLGTS